MTASLQLDAGHLQESGGHHTAREIRQQPDCWLETLGHVSRDQDGIGAWLDNIRSRTGLRVVLTGAGTSAYIGDTLAPLLSANTGLRVESIPTTHIVAQPASYFLAGTPTLLVSFARSGNSPESAAVVDIAAQLLGDDFAHLAITCNSDGALSKRASADQNSQVLNLSDDCNDRGFAMTSSFTSMLVAAAALFLPEASTAVARAAEQVRPLLERDWNTLDRQDDALFSRAIFLGAGSLYGIAREAALKTLELSAGQVPAFCETPMGFRHGPKSLVDNDTLVVVLRSSDPYTQRYDDDLINELKHDGVAHVEVLETRASDQALGDLTTGLTAVAWCQIFAFLTSLRLGITPDNPSPSGHVNRVVQGVTIHPYP